MADQPVSKTEVVDFRAQQAKFAAERAYSELREREAEIERLRAYGARVKTSLTNRDSLQANLPVGMTIDITSSDAQGLQHFSGGEAMVVGHSGGSILLDFGYGKTSAISNGVLHGLPMAHLARRRRRKKRRR
jgi:hypothetical protein